MLSWTEGGTLGGLGPNGALPVGANEEESPPKLVPKDGLNDDVKLLAPRPNPVDSPNRGFDGCEDDWNVYDFFVVSVKSFPPERFAPELNGWRFVSIGRMPAVLCFRPDDPPAALTPSSYHRSAWSALAKRSSYPFCPASKGRWICFEPLRPVRCSSFCKNSLSTSRDVVFSLLI